MLMSTAIFLPESSDNGIDLIDDLHFAWRNLLSARIPMMIMNDVVTTNILVSKLVIYLLLYLSTNYNICYSCINFLYIKLIQIYTRIDRHTPNKNASDNTQTIKKTRDIDYKSIEKELHKSCKDRLWRRFKRVA